MLEEVRSLRPAERFWTPQEVSGGKAPLLPPSGTMGWGDREARGQCVGLWLTLLPGPQGPSLWGEPGEQPELAPLGTKPRASLRSEHRPLQRPSSGFTGRREGLQPGGGRSCPSLQAGGGMAPGPSSEQGFPKPAHGAHPEKTLPGSAAVENGGERCLLLPPRVSLPGGKETQAA